MLVALGLPLTITLQQRTIADLENRALIEAQGIAAAIGAENINDPGRLQEIARAAAQQVQGRVVVVDRAGFLLADEGFQTELADTTAPEQIGDLFAVPTRPEIVAALQGNPRSEIRDSADLGHDIMATAVPIQDEERRVGAVRITRNIQSVNDQVRNTTLGLLAIGAAALLAGLLIAFGMAGSLSRPLTRLARAARRLGSGDLSARAEDVGGASEIEELGRSFDEMADRLERTVQAQREFVANASHQLRTPLTGMKLRLETAIADATDESVRRQLEAADREVDRLSEIVNRLLELSRDIEEGRPTHVDLGEAVTRAVGRWQERARKASATIVARGDGGMAQGNPSDVDQILDNLLDNAIAYAPGEIAIETGADDGRVFVAVQDHGPGIAQEDVTKVTERFFRGRGAPSGGSGLGLAIAKELAEKWGGSVLVTSGPGEGTRVEVRLRTSAA
jgi:signal transduction histidine kinase